MTSKVAVALHAADGEGTPIAWEIYLDIVAAADAANWTMTECEAVSQKIAATLHDIIQDGQELFCLPGLPEAFDVTIKINLPSHSIVECSRRLTVTKEAFDGELEFAITEMVDERLCSLFLREAV